MLRVVERAEADRVERRDRPRAHREDVAQDAAHAGRRALRRLDERRVVVALDLEDHREAVADRDGAGVLARARPARARPVVGRFFRCTRLDLYEQCSDHITEKIPSSEKVGVRPRIARMRCHSSSLSPCSRASCWSTTRLAQRGSAHRRASGEVDQRAEQHAAVAAAGELLDRVLGMRHQAHHVARARCRRRRCSRRSRSGSPRPSTSPAACSSGARPGPRRSSRASSSGATW